MKVQATTQNKIGQFVWSLARTLLVHKRYVRKLTTLNVPADVVKWHFVRRMEKFIKVILQK